MGVESEDAHYTASGTKIFARSGNSHFGGDLSQLTGNTPADSKPFLF